MFRLSPPRSDTNQFYLNSVYLKTIVNQGWKRYETDFQELEVLNSGEFYSVVKVINKIDSQIYAIKKIQIQLSNQQQIETNLQRVLKEVKYLALLNHPNIMRYYNSWIQMIDCNNGDQTQNKFNYNEIQSPLKIQKDQFTYNNKSSKERISYSEAESNSSDSQNIVSDNILSPKQKKMSPWIISRSCGKKFKQGDKINIFIQTEYCDQSLQNYLNNNIFDIQNSIQIALKIVSALEYIHQECKLVHRDLRPDNIFINNQNDVRIGDFGLMRKIKKLLGSKQYQQFGFVDDGELQQITNDSSQFQAPELQDNNPNKLYDNRIDIYSFGLILLLLFLPRMSINEQKKMLYEARIYYNIPNELWKNNILIAEIIEKCLQKDPNQRCQLQQIREVLLQIQESQFIIQNFDEQILGIQEIQLDDEEIKNKRYLRKYGYQLLIHKSREHKKAMGCYDLRKCRIQIINGRINIEHEELMSLWIDCQDQYEMERLIDQLLQK